MIWAVALLIGLPLLLCAALYCAGSSTLGRHWIEAATAHLSAGKVTISGLSGRLPVELDLARLELRDPQGLWLTANALHLHWSPLQLLRRDVRAQLLRAERVAIERRPAYASTKKSGPSAWRHFHFELERLAVDRLELGADLAGNPVAARAQGSGVWFSIKRASLQLSLQRLDGVPATYTATARFNGARSQGQLDIEEAADGPLGHLTQWPTIGALSIHLRFEGPPEAVGTTLVAQAGALRAQAQGKVNLLARSADVTLLLDAAAMAPRPGYSWQRLHLHGQWAGALSTPDISAQLQAASLEVPGLALGTLSAELAGQRGDLKLEASATGLTMPGRYGKFLAAAPVALQAHLRLNEPTHTLEFSLAHPILSANGHWTGRPYEGNGNVTLSTAELRPLAALVALDLQGRGKLQGQVHTHAGSARIEASASFDISGGAPALVGALGPSANLNAALTLAAHNYALERSQLESSVLQASLRGSDKDGVLDVNWTLALRDLARLSPRLAGHAEGQGTLRGQAPQLALAADVDAQLAANGSQSGALRLQVRAHDLPAQASGELRLAGALDGAPIELDASLARDALGAWVAKIDRGQWRSAEAEGELRLASDASAPRGRLALRMAHLEELDQLLAFPVRGSIDARADLDGEADSGAQLHIEGTDVGISAQQMHSVELTGNIKALGTHPVLALQLAAQGVLENIPVSVQTQLDGPIGAVVLHLTAASEGDAQARAALDATATFSAERRELRLSALRAQYRGETLQLASPALVSFAQGIAVQDLRMAAGTSQLQLQGRLTPALDLSVSLHDLSPQLLHPWLPNLEADGSLDADAQLHGSFAAPTGSVNLQAHGLHSRKGATRAFPAVELTATAQLQGSVAQLDLRLDSGPGLRLQVSGQAPLNSAAPIALKLGGALDLALANPVLEASGQRLQGQAQLAADIAGTLSAPLARGTLQLAHADLQDYPRGLHLSEINATLAGDGGQWRLQSFSARAGPGSVSANGTVGLGAGMPVEFSLQGKNAQTLTSDLITANVDINLKLSGQLRGALNASGDLHINRADIHIPDAFPPSVAVLDVRRAGQPVEVPQPSGWSRVGLDIAIAAPRAVFIQGRGINAEVGGTMHVAGTIGDPAFSGGFDLRSGTFAMGGASLTFTSGRVSFNGTGVRKKVDPTLDFTSTRMVNNISATLTIGGYADAPEIKLSSSPEETGDEILALVLFGAPPTQLSTLQVAQIAAALASMTAGGGFSPLTAVQRKLGLDRLAISGTTSSGASPTTSAAGTGQAANAATIEAGRYVSRRVFVGAKQSTTGTTQAEVQVDLTQHLKIQSVLGTGGGTLQGATPQNDPGSSVGLTYQLEF
ncbi:MAG: translocation/assembly module TamB domain-containing protein [Steroidobacteraceae bacterium]